MNHTSITEAHNKSSNHRDEIELSETCGCFHCLAIFAPKNIDEWVDEDDQKIGTTALCPRCGIDSVIGSKSGYPIEEVFLRKMKKYYF